MLLLLQGEHNAHDPVERGLVTCPVPSRAPRTSQPASVNLVGWLHACGWVPQPLANV